MNELDGNEAAAADAAAATVAAFTKAECAVGEGKGEDVLLHSPLLLVLLLRRTPDVLGKPPNPPPKLLPLPLPLLLVML